MNVINVRDIVVMMVFSIVLLIGIEMEVIVFFSYFSISISFVLSL